MSDRMIAYCGLDCFACPAYLATQAGDSERLSRVAERWSRVSGTDIPPGSLACDGCKSGSERINDYCSACPVSSCCKNRGFDTCAECPDYPCPALESHPAFDEEARGNLERLKRAL